MVSTVSQREPVERRFEQPSDELLLQAALVWTSTVDTRTATEYGVVRTFADMVFSVSIRRQLSPAATRRRSLLVGTAGLGLYHAFIQFAGFTIGRTVSIFDAPWTGYPAGGPDTIPGGSNHVTGINQFAYTADFGQGITGSLAFESPDTQSNGQWQPVECDRLRGSAL